MKTTIITLTICISLYAGLGAIKNTTNTLSSHTQQLNNTVAMMEKR